MGVVVVVFRASAALDRNGLLEHRGECCGALGEDTIG